MTTTRQKLLMLAAILGLSVICGWEAMGMHGWNTLAFGAMAVSCAAMFVWQVGEEKTMTSSYLRYGSTVMPRARLPVLGFVTYRRVLFDAIRRSRNWTWRVKR